jgi:hypothetical protein
MTQATTGDIPRCQYTLTARWDGDTEEATLQCELPTHDGDKHAFVLASGGVVMLTASGASAGQCAAAVGNAAEAALAKARGGL